VAVSCTEGTEKPFAEHKSLEGERLDPAHIFGHQGQEKRRSIEIRRNADSDQGEIQRIVDEAVAEVRAERRTKQNADKA
jgi:hypothetical protein